MLDIDKIADEACDASCIAIIDNTKKFVWFIPVKPDGDFDNNLLSKALMSSLS